MYFHAYQNQLQGRMKLFKIEMGEINKKLQTSSFLSIYLADSTVY